MRRLTRVCVVVFGLFLAGPILQGAFRIVPHDHLSGVEFKADKADLSVRAWFDGSFQKQFEKWLNEHMGLRSYFVRTFNQVHFSLFGRLPEGKGTRVVIGKKSWLYEDAYIRLYNREGRASKDVLNSKVSDLKKLQDLLKARKKAFLLVIAPSKVEIYPEYVPDGILEAGRGERKTEYDRIIPLLDSAGINYVDAHKLFLQWKKELTWPLFSTSGTHWNYCSAGLVVDQIFKRCEPMLGRDLPHILLKAVTTDFRVKGRDNDLGDLLNLLYRQSVVKQQVHPVFEKKASSGGYRPSILFVGDSFVSMLVEIMYQQKLCGACDVFYYFKRRYTWPDEEGGTKIDISSVDWEKDVLSYDGVVIEINEHWLPDFGFGFVQAAIEGLDAKRLQ